MPNHENAISNLLYSYTERFDAGDQEGAAELFKHARIIVGENGECVDYLGLLANWRAIVILDEETGSPRTKHCCTNAIIEVDEANRRATARSYYIVYQQTPTLPLQPIVAGRYHDIFEYVDNQWRFSERDYRMMDLIGDLSQHLRGYQEILAARQAKQ